MTTTTSDVNVGEGRLQVTRTGNRGQPVLMAAHPADAFEAASAELMADAAQTEVVCVNPRGVGASSPGVQTVEDMADDLERVRRALGLGEVLFWGMSGGGWLGLAWAHRHPGALRGLVLESVCACFRARLDDPACVLSPNNPAWCRKLERTSQNEGGWGEIEGVGSVLRGGAGEPLVVAPFPLDARMKAIMPRLLELDARPWLGTLRVPALVIAGSDDVVAPVAHVRSLAEALRAQWLEVAGAGHVPSATRHDEVTTAIRAFVARTAVQA